jgi:EAL domain-containing protein (putative c-di-GMP-specific phosphodiesterase class I)
MPSSILAKCLRLTVTAEGVENEAQLLLLREYQCDEAQGYFFGKPISAEEVTGGIRGDR